MLYVNVFLDFCILYFGSNSFSEYDDNDTVGNDNL